jgi:hypothetical protein
MENPTQFEAGGLDRAVSPPDPPSRAHAAPIDWQPPGTREEAEATIVALSNDIGLILAQLSEDQAAWCQRTGRSAFDYAAWRRRALFAKVHKEHQLRECKRIRFQLSEHVVEVDNDEGALLARLTAECYRVIRAWRRAPRQQPGDAGLDAALAHLAACLAGNDGEPHVPVDLIGAVENGELAG